MTVLTFLVLMTGVVSSTAASLSAVGLELKTVVEQFREQVQNLE